MERFKLVSKNKINQLPKTAGIYTFKSPKGILYIGKAANIQERVKNHFQNNSYRDNLFIDQVKKVGFIKTDSEIEALLLEANLIKKYQPKYNVIWRDDKNYFYVAITREELPRIFITHQIKSRNSKFYILYSKFQHIGPFVEGTALKKTLIILRKIFPYYSQKKHPKNLCPWCHLSLCPGPNPDKKEYKKNVKNLTAVLEGKRKSALNNLKKEMKISSREENFEKAAKLRDQITSLEKIISNAKIFPPAEYVRKQSKDDEALLHLHLRPAKRDLIIEAYDVSNIQGKDATGSMVTFINGRPDKNFYRRFKIKIAGKPNDTAMIREILSRRFDHPEWPYPDLVLIDGGKAQLNVAKSTINNQQLTIPVVALAKKHNELFVENRKKPILLKSLPRGIFNLILQLRDEAHRFAISYHKKLRMKGLLGE